MVSTAATHDIRTFFDHQVNLDATAKTREDEIHYTRHNMLLHFAGLPYETFSMINISKLDLEDDGDQNQTEEKTDEETKKDGE